MEHKAGFYEKYIKRALDLLLSCLALIILAPVIPVIALLVRVKLGSPVIFRQERPGKDGKIFRLYKFRTMTDARDADGKLLPDGERMTRFGKMLRSTSLDELPELWNIFKGEMSIVGPRPLLVQYLPLYSEEQAHRHDVRPGLTGWAQAHGRNALSWEQRFELDVWYTRNISFKTDVKVIWLTLKSVLCREGISADGEATMCAFTGTKE